MEVHDTIYSYNQIQLKLHELQDFRGNSELMSGASVILFGDFWQTLPVFPKPTSANEIDACLKKVQAFQWRKGDTL